MTLQIFAIAFLFALMLGTSVQAQTLDPVFTVPVEVDGTRRSGRALAFSPDGSVLAMACDSGVVLLWDVETGQLVQELEKIPETLVVPDISFSPDGKSIAGGTWEGKLVVWNRDDGRIRYSVQAQDQPVAFVGYIDGGTKIYAYQGLGILSIFESTGGDLLYQVGGDGEYGVVPLTVIPGERAFYALWFSSEALNEKRLDSVEMREYSIEDGRVLGKLPLAWDSAVPLWILMSTPDGARWYRFGTGNQQVDADNLLYETNPETFAFKRELVEADTNKKMTSFSFSPDNRRLLGGGFGQVMIWNLKTAEIEYELFRDPGLVWVWDVSFSPDGRTAVAIVSQELYIWRIPTSAVANPVAGDYPSFGLQVSPNPVRTHFTVTFQLDRGGKIDLDLYDVRGEKVQELDTEYYESGRHNIEYAIPALSSGMYWLRIETRNGMQIIPISVF